MKMFFWNILKKIRKFIIYRILNKETHGVRIALLQNNQILLIKHPYDIFWVLPGGGIKKKEKPESAALREVYEETRYHIHSETTLKKLGIYKNNSGGKRDIVHVFVCHEFTKSEKTKKLIDKIEIEKQKWFDMDNMPEISSATKNRIIEITNNQYSLDKVRAW